MFEYDKDVEQAAKALDEYDLSLWIEEFLHTSSDDFYDFIDFVCDKNEKMSSIIDELSTEEFMEYILDTYNVTFRECTRYVLVREEAQIKKYKS